MRSAILYLMATIAASCLILTGCSQAAPAPAATTAPASAAKAAEPTKPAEAPKAPASVPPTAAPTAAPKVDFPQKGKTINWIVAAGNAGGGTDLCARTMAPILEKEVGAQVQVVNKPGAGGQTGWTELAQSKPDGYTLASSNFPGIIMTALDTSRKAVYNKKAFTLVGTQYDVPKVLVVRGDSPYKTTKDLVEAAKAHPGEIKAAAGGILGDTHLSLLALEQVAGVDLALVHFDGGAPGVAALLGGHVDASSNVPSEVSSHLKSGQLRALGMFTKEESKFLPGVPTLASQGYPAYMNVLGGIIAPAGLPQDVANRLTAASKKAVESPEHANKLEELGFSAKFMNPDEFSKAWDECETQFKPLLELALKE
jgi:tripartite-type tricarboxylate transporter receptor subunit TctC